MATITRTASGSESSVQVTRSTCCYCGVGCGVLIETEDGRVRGVKGDPDHPANFGKLCSKGATLHLTAQPHIYQQVRAAYPELRRSRHENRARTDWDGALDEVARRFYEIIQRDGPDAVAFYVSGQLLTEDYYVFNKLAKGLIGTNNIDTNSRLCMSSAVAGYKQTLGADSPPCSYEDLDHARVMFITGSNMAFAHPVLFRRLEQSRKRNPDLKLIVVDTRRTDTAQSADLFLQIAPGTDVALHYGMLHVMLWEGWIDWGFVKDHTEGFEGLKERVSEFTPKAVAQYCGIREVDLKQAAQWFSCAGPTLSLYCQGLNQSASGTAKNASLINLHLATGQIGKPGAGPFSLTGQPNAMGGREVGGMANLLSAHRDMANGAHRQEVADLWDVPTIPETPGLTAVELFDALHGGTVKAVWIVCTNPAQSMPDQAKVHEALSRAEFVVVQDAYRHTATVAFADVLLPATTWAEKEGTVTNSERRITRVRAAIPPYGEARHDWAIAVEVGKRLERLLGRSTRSGTPLLPYDTPQSIWEEHRASTVGRDLDISGLSYRTLEETGPQQWPYPAGAVQGTVRLYGQGVFATPSGRACFVAPPFSAVAEPVDARYPFALITGRLRDQWHGMGRTGTLARLGAHAPEPVIQLSAMDCARLGLESGDLVQVVSRRGEQVLPVQESEEVAPTQCFIAMHWGEEWVGGRTGTRDNHGVNGLTLPLIDPVSRQPELKHAAVRILKANLPWRLTAFAWIPQEQVLSVQMRLRSWIGRFSYGSCVLFGHETETMPGPVGIFLRLANDVAGSDELMKSLASDLDLQEDRTGVLRYEDKRRGVLRLIRVGSGVSGQKLEAVLVSGERAQVTAASWLREYLESGVSVDGLGRALLMPGTAPPGKIPVRGKIICSCLNVSEKAIQGVLQDLPLLAPDKLLEKLQAQLGCGTNCGSCVPELKRMVANRDSAAQTHS